MDDEILSALRGGTANLFGYAYNMAATRVSKYTSETILNGVSNTGITETRVCHGINHASVGH